MIDNDDPRNEDPRNGGQLDMAAAAFGDRASQASLIEQTRATAEVAGAMQLARQFPRDEVRVLAEMRRDCGRISVADEAFYSYPRGGKIVSGVTIKLARQIALCWRNVQFGIQELSRNTVRQESEMQAMAWDLERNVRSFTSFIVPHFKDVDGQIKPLLDLRSIYENNANMGGRRLRQMILAVLPPWYVEEAVMRCQYTLEHPPDETRPLARQASDWVEIFETRLNIVQLQLEEKIGRPADKWTTRDMATLRVLAESLNRGDVQVEEVFPSVRVTGAEIAAQAAANAPKPAEPEPPADPRDTGVSPLTYSQDPPDTDPAS